MNESGQRRPLEQASEERYAMCGDRRLLVEWDINRHIFCTFEIATDLAETIVPDRLQVVEVRPGAALLSFGVLRYEPGHFAPDSPEFNEVVIAVHVSPDLSTDMPVPNMTLFAFTVVSDSQDFVDMEGHTLFTPTSLNPSLAFDFSADGLGVHVHDEQGPILTLENRLEDPAFSYKEMWGQHYTFTRGPQHGVWQWDGMLTEHQRPDRNWELFEHPIWQKVDVSKIRRCYRQMLLQPGSKCHERFYEMRKMDG